MRLCNQLEESIHTKKGQSLPFVLKLKEGNEWVHTRTAAQKVHQTL